jgi:hypothetical protein
VTGRDGARYFAERNTDQIVSMTTSGTITKRVQLAQGANPVSLAATRRGLYISEHSLSGVGRLEIDC